MDFYLCNQFLVKTLLFEAFLSQNHNNQVLALDSGQSLNWQTPDVLGGKE